MATNERSLDLAGINPAGQDLRRSDRALCDVVDTIPAIVWSALSDGSNAYVNSRFVDYWGMSAEQLAGSGSVIGADLPFGSRTSFDRYAV